MAFEAVQFVCELGASLGGIREEKIVILKMKVQANKDKDVSHLFLWIPHCQVQYPDVHRSMLLGSMSTFHKSNPNRKSKHFLCFRDPYASRDGSWATNQANVTPTRFTPRDTRSLPMANRLGGRSGSSDSVYTIVIKLPGDPKESHHGTVEPPSIKMIPEDSIESNFNNLSKVNSNSTVYANHVNRRPSAMPDVRIPLNAKGNENTIFYQPFQLQFMVLEKLNLFVSPPGRNFRY